MSGSNPTVSPYVGQGEVKIRVSAKASTQPKAKAMIAPIEAELISRGIPSIITGRMIPHWKKWLPACW